MTSCCPPHQAQLDSNQSESSAEQQEYPGPSLHPSVAYPTNPLFEGATTRSRAVTLQHLRPEELSSPARAWPVNPPSSYVAPTPEHLSLDFASPEGGTPRRLFDWAESPASVRQPTPGIQRTHAHLQESPWRAVEQHKASSPSPVEPQWRAAVDSRTGGHTPRVPQAPVGAMDASISKLGATWLPATGNRRQAS